MVDSPIEECDDSILTVTTPSLAIPPHQSARSSRIKTIDICYPQDCLLDLDYILALVTMHHNVEHLYLSAGGIHWDPLNQISCTAKNWLPTLRTLTLRFFEDVKSVHCLLRHLPSSMQTRIDIYVEILNRAKAWDVDGLSVFLGLTMHDLDPFFSANWLSISQRSLSIRDRDETPHVQLHLGHYESLDLVGVDPFLTITKGDPHLRCLSQTFCELSGIISARSMSITILRIELDEPIQMEDLLQALASFTRLISLTVVLSHHGDIRESCSWLESPNPFVVLSYLQDLTIIACGPMKNETPNQCAARDRLLGRITFPDAVKVNRLFGDMVFDTSTGF